MNTITTKILIIVLLGLLMYHQIFAGELFVTQNLKVHAQPSLDSPVNHLLLGGQKVTVIRIDGDMTEITDEVGHQGWVSSEFLTDVAPAKVVKPVKNTFKPKDTPSTIASSTTANNTANKKNKQKSPLKQKFKASHASKMNTHKPIPESFPEHTGQAQLIRSLHQNITQLKQHITQLETLLDQPKKPSWQAFFQEYRNLLLVIILLTLIVGFILGMLWSDFLLRKRHGGFKL